jgi:hypothetical protein
MTTAAVICGPFAQRRTFAGELPILDRGWQFAVYRLDANEITQEAGGLMRGCVAIDAAKFNASCHLMSLEKHPNLFFILYQ